MGWTHFWQEVVDHHHLSNFLKRLRTVCYKSVDCGLSYKPYKTVVGVKSLHNLSNLKPNDPHAFKEELKIKFGAVLAIAGKFPNGTGVLEHLLKAKTPQQNWGHYCAMLAADQLVWEEKASALNKAMLPLMNLKNYNAKKDLRFAYSQGNISAYPLDIESMARYLLLMYNIKNVNNPRNKKGNKNWKKGDEPKSEDKDNNNTSTTGWGNYNVSRFNCSYSSKGSSIGAHVNHKYGTFKANYYTVWYWMELCPVYDWQQCIYWLVLKEHESTGDNSDYLV